LSRVICHSEWRKFKTKIFNVCFDGKKHKNKKTIPRMKRTIAIYIVFTLLVLSVVFLTVVSTVGGCPAALLKSRGGRWVFGHPELDADEENVLQDNSDDDEVVKKTRRQQRIERYQKLRALHQKHHEE
jgi:hypothetical protein